MHICCIIFKWLKDVINLEMKQINCTDVVCDFVIICLKKPMSLDRKYVQQTYTKKEL